MIAKNKAGKGEPSDPTESVLCKPRNLAPRIHREDLDDTTVKVGQPIKFRVNIDGEPPPKVTWTCNGGALPQGVKIDDADYLSNFEMPKATRKHAGTYTITATNENGTDSVTIKVRD